MKKQVIAPAGIGPSCLKKLMKLRHRITKDISKGQNVK